MKKFDARCGKTVVYIQFGDLLFLNENNFSIPENIKKTMLDLTIYGGCTSIKSFIAFDEEEDVLFFKNIDWILDCDEYQIMSLEKILEKRLEIIKKLEFIESQIDNPNNSKINFTTLLIQSEQLGYMLDSLDRVIASKSEINKLYFPLINDFDRNIESLNKYNLEVSLEKDEILVSRKDNEIISKNDKNLMEDLKNIIPRILTTSTDYKISCSYSFDKKFLKVYFSKEFSHQESFRRKNKVLKKTFFGKNVR